MTTITKTTPAWATELIAQYIDAARALGQDGRHLERHLTHRGGHWFRLGRSTVTRVKITREIEALRARAERIAREAWAAVLESEEVAYWESRGIHTGHPHVATIVLQP